ncbi:MAG: hypothetical protein V4640_11645 [Verrucomicrobiota bacterium]
MSYAFGGDLAVVENDSSVATQYSLSRAVDGRAKQVIWSKRVDKVDGEKPNLWCRLGAWDENEHGIIAILEFNEGKMGVLQFDAQAKLISEISVTNGDWNRAAGGNGSFKPIAPAEITLKTLLGKVSKFYIRDGELIGEDGAKVDRTGGASEWLGTKENLKDQNLKLKLNESGSSKIRDAQTFDDSKPPRAKTEASGQLDKADAEILFSVVALLILVMFLAALWLLKWRKA